MTETPPTHPIFKAIRDGDAEQVRSLLDSAPWLVEAKCGEHLDALTLAISCERPEVVRVLLQHGGDASRAIRAALLQHDPEILRALLDAGADPNTPVALGWTDANISPLHFAAEWDYLTMAEILLDRGADPNAVDETGNTPLHLASHGYDVGMTRLIAAHGADVNARDADGTTPLFDAVGSRLAEMVQLLIDAGADVSVRDDDGRTAMSFAIQPDSSDTVGRMSEQGEVEYIDSRSAVRQTMFLLAQHIGMDNLSPHEATAVGDLERVRAYLFSSPRLLDERDHFGFTLLHYAAAYSHVSVVELLLRCGARVDGEDEDGGAPIHQAARFGHTEIVRLLLEYGADAGVKDNLDSTPLHEAVYHAPAELVRLLLEHGADPNAADSDGNRPLHFVDDDRPENVRLLIEAGADVNAGGYYGDLPLYGVGYPQTAQILLDAGADPCARQYEQTPLFSAIESGHAEVVEVLLQAVEPSIFDLAALGDLDMLKERLSKDLSLLFACDTERRNSSLLHYAAELNRVAVAEYLLSQGTPADIRDDEGATPLYIAAESKAYEVAQFLVANGADVNAVTSNDDTPLHRAAAAPSLPIAELLVTHGADVNACNSYGDTPSSILECSKIGVLLCRNGAVW